MNDDGKMLTTTGLTVSAWQTYLDIALLSAKDKPDGLLHILIYQLPLHVQEVFNNGRQGSSRFARINKLLLAGKSNCRHVV